MSNELKEGYSMKDVADSLISIARNKNWSNKQIVEFLFKEYKDRTLLHSVVMLHEILIELGCPLSDETYYNLARTDTTISYKEVCDILPKASNDYNSRLICLYDLGRQGKISKDQLELLLYIDMVDDNIVDTYFYDFFYNVSDKSFRRYCRKQYKKFGHAE